MSDKSLGIYSLKTNIFYFLETGKMYIGNTVDRLKKILVKRKVLTFTNQDLMSTAEYKVMPVRDAKLKEYEMVGIPISKHVANTITSEAEVKEVSSWEAKKKKPVKAKKKE